MQHFMIRWSNNSAQSRVKSNYNAPRTARNSAQEYVCCGGFVAAVGHARRSLDIRCGLFYCCHYNSYAAIAVAAVLYLLL